MQEWYTEVKQEDDEQHRLALRGFANAPSLQCGEVRRLGKCLGNNPAGKRQAQRMDKCERERLLQ